MIRPFRMSLLFMALVSFPLPLLAADEPDTMVVQHPEVIVSSTRTKRDQVNVPNATSVLLGKDLARRGTRTLADALQDVVGLDTGDGSDNGTRVPNVGMWGLKEFDALLFTLNGVPVGGPFNPSLTQMPIEDIERVEISKGPQGTMYGVSAFAGMIQVFTPETQEPQGRFDVGGGSFSQGHGNLMWGRNLGNDRDLRLNGAYERADGFQDRTSYDRIRGNATYGFGTGRARWTLDVAGLNDDQDWGSPLKYEEGELVPGFVIDRNYAVKGAKVEHQVWSGTARTTWPLSGQSRIENTLGVAWDKQHYLRTFPGEIIGDTLVSEGLELEPKENSLYEDVRWVNSFEKSGSHELVAGAALTLGETKGTGREFEFDQLLSDYASIPDVSDVEDGDPRDFEDKRTFVGLYAHDAWTPMPKLTIEGGGRFDMVSEELETEADLPSGPVAVNDKRDDSKFSGDISALWRLLPSGGERLQTANLYGSLRHAFKPAAPNLAEAEAAEILEPETTDSWEVGLKSRAFHEMTFNASYFDMTFKNMVVSILGSGGLPELTNAGEQRFRGFETDLSWMPKQIQGLTLDLGYAHHNARFVDFTFVDPDLGTLVDVSGNKLEMVPADLFNARASLSLPSGIGGFVAARWQGERPFDKDNAEFAEAFTTVDAGLSYERQGWRASVVGRNLGDDRNVVTESEIGDSEFYISPPRRFTAEIGYHF